MLRRALLLIGSAALVQGCDYVRLLRPSVVKQLNPRVVEFVNFLPEVDAANEALVARLAGHGGLGHARVGADSIMRATIRAPRNELIWEPAVLVLPRPGVLLLEVVNYDQHFHAIGLPSLAEKEVLELPARSRGVARIVIDHAGLYTFACPIANHGGRGMLGFLIVKGEAPPDARLDRPALPRP